MRFAEPVGDHVFVDFGEVELWRIPATDAVIGAKVALDLEIVGRRRLPLEKEVNYLLFPTYI